MATNSRRRDVSGRKKPQGKAHVHLDCSLRIGCCQSSASVYRGDGFLGEGGRNTLNCFARQRGSQQAAALKTGSPFWRDEEGVGLQFGE